ncbi:PaaI family thioesterase [Pokkaliibacter plantistimulans]|uniref:PaaI family thioesterase n=1 Tax=Pokkaliibacter plantistimulans TaxID=1635171 RepID=UPI000D741013|nr:PaaI family thioesterase [Pokkaliibacter plantistimulans]
MLHWTSAEDLNQYLLALFDHPYGDVIALKHHHATMKMRTDHRHIRPGNTVSGPTLMGLADVAFYAALLGAIGPAPLAVTTNLSINFMRKADAGSAIIADAKLFKLGKRLAVGEVLLRNEDQQELIAHVTTTYAIPPNR